jgi:hypothetical protein
VLAEIVDTICGAAYEKLLDHADVVRAADE